MYVFSEPAYGGWRTATQSAELTASDGAAGDRLGDSVAVSGRTVAAGSMLHAIGANSEQGAVYVFAAPASGGWRNATETAELTASNGAAGDALGYSVALSGASLVAGAYNHAVGSAGNPGAVYVFAQPASGKWKNATQSVELTASNGADGDEVGYSVAIDRGTIVAGPPEHLVGASGQQGAAYVLGGSHDSYVVVTYVRQSHKLWRAGTHLPTFARHPAARILIGTTFSFTLGEPARVIFDFTHQVLGRRVKGRCVALNARNRRKRPCTLTVRAGSLVFMGHEGDNKVFFEGVLARRKKLQPGRYTLTITATNAGRRSRPQRLSFAIVK